MEARDSPASSVPSSSLEALTEAQRLAEHIQSPEQREVALATVGSVWALWGNPARAHPLVDRISPNQDPFPQSPWGALLRARAGLAYAYLGAQDSAVQRFGGALEKFKEVPAAARAGLSGAFCLSLSRAHEQMGDPRLVALVVELGALEGSPSERVQAQGTLLQMELHQAHLEGARKLAQGLLDLLRSPHLLDEPALDRLVEFVISYVELTSDRGVLADLQERAFPLLGRPLLLKAQSLVGRLLREMGEALRGERMLREAQGDLPALKGIADRVRIGLELAKLLAEDGNAPATETLLEWTHEQLLPTSRPGQPSPFEEVLLRGRASAHASLGRLEELRADSEGWLQEESLPLRDSGLEFLVSRLGELAAEPALLARRLQRLRERLESSAPETFRRLDAEAERSLRAQDLPEARRSVVRAHRVALAYLAEMPNLAELWTTLRELKTAFDQWDPRWGDRRLFLKDLDSAQEALKLRDWRRLRMVLRRAQETLHQKERAAAGPTELPPRGESAQRGG